LLLVGKFYGVVYFGCTVCHGDSFRALRERYYRLDTKNLTSSSVQAKMRTTVKKLLKKYKYPPDQTTYAVNVVIEQAKLMCENEVI
ncbi:MAG: DUF3387 domain-containing protein, partial [Sutterella sp.]|nr:DUF3387 domain-containing protein [Sutterella sp.]